MANNKKGFGKFLVGLGLGAGLTALFTTKKGKEIREDLMVKIEDLIIKAKNLDVKEVGDEFLKKVEEIKEDLSDLDKEKVMKIAKKKGEELKEKTEELICLAKEKGTPILENVANEVREKTILVIKDVLNKLENNQ